MRAVKSVVVLSLATLGAADQDPHRDQLCFDGCNTALSGQMFDGTPTILDDYYLELCQNVLHVESLYLCSLKYCGMAQTLAGIRYFNQYCEQYAFSSALNLDIVRNYTDLDTVPIREFGAGPMLIKSPIVPSQELFDLGFRTTKTWYGTKDHHQWYCNSLYIFWGVICAFGVANNTISRLRASMTFKNTSPSSERAALSSTTYVRRFWTRTRANLLQPATFGGRCDVPAWQCTIPPRIETLVIVAFIALNIIVTACSYVAFDNNLFWATKNAQIWRYFSDRTGYLAYANLAILWLFGIRNNILLWITGWRFATFNRFHRWVARLAVLHAALHSIGYTVFTFITGDLASYKENFLEQYWYTGVIATITMTLILGFSVLVLRVRLYEFFLIAHIVLALVTLVNLFYHTRIFNGEYDGYLYACVAFWSFDRLMRIMRIGYILCKNGLRSFNVEFSEEARLLRIDVTDVMTSTNAQGGTNYYVYSPFTWKGWENHPFTLVRWRQDTSDSDSLSSSSQELPVDQGIEKSTTVTTVQYVPAGSVQYSLLVRPKKGWTQSLSRRAASAAGSKNTSLLLEGSYGHSPKLTGFSDILLIIGGSGISVGISFIYNAMESNPNASLHLVWSSRNRGLIDSVLNKELKAAVKSSALTVDTFVTREITVSTVAPELARKTQHHRPNAKEAVREAAANRRGPLAIVVCGPASLNDDVRAAVVEEFKEEQHDITFFSEAFNW